jgi:hypothetical protein
MTVEDDRLPAKASIYSFRMGDTPYAVPHDALEGGVLLETEESRALGLRVLLYRTPGAALYASTRAYRVPADLVQETKRGIFLIDPTYDARSDNRGGKRLDPEDPKAFFEVLDVLERSEVVTRLTGFDTFWYTWVAVHPETLLMP